jgi:hypothetical protein
VRHLHANERLIAELQSSKEQLVAVNQSLSHGRDVLQAELDVLRPRYASLYQAYSASSLNNWISVVTMGVGGALISSASYIANTFAGPQSADKVATAIVGGGWGVLIIGGAVLLVTTISDQISKWRFTPKDNGR